MNNRTITKQDTFHGLANAVNSFGIYEDLSPTKKIAYKLVSACMNSLNKKLAVCQDMPGAIDRGNYYLELFKKEGRLSGRGVILDSRLNITDVIFTDPDSEAYCIQSLYLNLIVPEPRPIHLYPQNDIRQILKLRIKEATQLCIEPFPDFFTPRDIAERMHEHLTPNFEHPITEVYKTIVKITFPAFLSGAINFQAAGQEIINVRLNGKNESYNGTADVINQNLKNISNIFIRLACEPKRLAYADKLYDLDPLEKLWLTTSTHEDIIDHHVRILTKMIPTSYLDYKKPADVAFQVTTFDLIDNVTLSTLNFLIAYVNFEIADALDYINHFSIQMIHNAIVSGCTPETSELIVNNIKNSSLIYTGSNYLLERCERLAFEESSSDSYIHNFIAGYLPSAIHEEEHAQDDLFHPSFFILLIPTVLTFFALLCVCRKKAYHSTPAQYCMKLFDRKNEPLPQEEKRTPRRKYN